MSNLLPPPHRCLAYFHEARTYGKQQRPVPVLIFIFDRILGSMCGLRIPDWLYGSKAGAWVNLAKNSCYVPIWDFGAMADLLAHPVSARILPRGQARFCGAAAAVDTLVTGTQPAVEVAAAYKIDEAQSFAGTDFKEHSVVARDPCPQRPWA